MNILRYLCTCFWIVGIMAASAFAQGPQLDWAASAGGSGFDIGRAAALDGLGNAYTTGFFQATADFDPGLPVANFTSGGDNDVYIQKLDAQGQFVWARSLGGTNVDEGKGIAVDAAGNVYVTGRFSGTVDFDPGAGVASATAVGMTDIFILKLDAAGQFVWARQLGGAGADEGTGLVADASGVYAVGYFQGTIDLDPGTGVNAFTSHAGTLDFWVMHLDAAGNHQWGSGLGSNGLEYGFAITRAATGEVFVTGCFQDTLDFDAGIGVATLTAAPGVTAAYVLNLHANGGFGWVRQVGTTGYCIGYGITTSPSGMLYVTGGVNGSIDFDPGPGTNAYSSTTYDVWVEKMTPMGGYLGAWAYGGIGDDYGYGIAVTPGNAVYVGGGYGATVDFDASTSGTYNITSFNNTFDGFIERTDTIGNFGWARSLGGGGIDYVFGLAADASNHVLTTGCYDQTVDFDTEAGVYNLMTTGNAEIFVHKIKQCAPSSGTVTLSGCDSLQVNGQFYHASGAFTQTLQNITGCDSLLTLNLTIGQSTAASVSDSACTQYSLNGFTYDSSGTYVQTLTNAAGCDSVLTLQLVMHTVDTSLYETGFYLGANAIGALYQWVDCQNGFQPMPNGTFRDFIPQTTSTYAVIVTQYGCTDTSSCYGFFNDAASDQLDLQIAAHPNPTRGDFVLDLGGMLGAAEVSIHNTMGQCIYTGQCENRQPLHLEGASGMYFLTVRTEAGARSLKIWKE
jgi:Beta-propeller repeat